MYVLVHGPDKGLSDLRTLAKNNTVPPPGFNVLPKPKEKHHYGSAIATTIIAGLLIYVWIFVTPTSPGHLYITAIILDHEDGGIRFCLGGILQSLIAGQYLSDERRQPTCTDAPWLLPRFHL